MLNMQAESPPKKVYLDVVSTIDSKLKKKQQHGDENTALCLWFYMIIGYLFKVLWLTDFHKDVSRLWCNNI